MNRLTLLIPFLIFIFSCSEQVKEKPIAAINSSSEKENTPTDTDLNGVWIMTNYLDSILENKTIAKFRLQPATWFAIIIEIKNDSIRTFGSIHDTDFSPIQFGTDSLITLKNSLTGDYSFKMNLKTGILEMKSNGNDSVNYSFKKRNDLKFLTENLDKIHKTSTNFTNYFNEKIIAKKYILNQKEINFAADGQLENFLGYKSYQVKNYFGTSHPFKNLDVLILKKEDGTIDYWNWYFEHENLILTKLFCDFKSTDKYELTKEIYWLDKKEH